MDLSLQLMAFQKAGVELLVKNDRFMLSWVPGVGKTPPAVRACARVKARSILVFCPPIATTVWRTHFRDWSGYSSVTVHDGSAHTWNDGVHIVPYSRASLGTLRVPDIEWDVVILDEAHYLKNPEAKRTRGVYGPALDLGLSPLARAKRIWCLTGTPLLNGPHELWTHLHALKPDLITYPRLGLMSYESFVSQYCRVRHTSYGYHVVGTKNTQELATRLKGFTDRKHMQDVLRDMPPLRVVTYELPESMVTYGPELSQALDDLRLEGLEGFTDEELLATFQAGNASFSTIRRLIGLAKVEGIVALVQDTLASGAEKVIIFAHHREVIHQLLLGLRVYNPLHIMGGTSPKSRDEAIERFQTTKDKVIILSIEAASEAITLNMSNQVIIAEPSPVPSKNAQAIARAHRRGQKNPVLAQFVTLPGTFDTRFMAMVARKTKDIMQIVDPDLAPPAPATQRPSFPDLTPEEELRI